MQNPLRTCLSLGGGSLLSCPLPVEPKCGTGGTRRKQIWWHGGAVGKDRLGNTTLSSITAAAWVTTKLEGLSLWQVNQHLAMEMSTLVFRAVPLLCLCSTLCGTPLWQLPPEPEQNTNWIINWNTSSVTSKALIWSNTFYTSAQWLRTISAVEDNWNNLTQAQEVIPKAGFYVCFEHHQQCWNICDPLEVITLKRTMLIWISTLACLC